MPCTEFDDLLADYADLTPEQRQRVDAHLTSCPSCRSWFEALTEVDTALDSRFEVVRAPASLGPRIREKIARPMPGRARGHVSMVPEILDFAGWLGVIGAAGLLAYFLIPPTYILTAPVVFASMGVLLSIALSVTVWVLRSSES